MMATKINETISHWIPYLVVCAISSLATTWALQTPVLQKKADTLEVVQEKVLPSMAGQLAKAKTELKQTECDKQIMVDVAVKGVIAEETSKSGDGPTWSDIHSCSKVAPVKAHVPVVTVTAQK